MDRPVGGAADLSRIGGASAPDLDAAALRQALLPMLDGLARALGYGRALVAIYDQHQRCLRGSLGVNVSTSLVELLEVSVDAVQHPMVRALLTGQPVRVDDVRQEARLDEHDTALLLELGITAFVAAPLRRPPDSGGAAQDGAAAARPAAGALSSAPAIGVVLLSKEGEISDKDLEWLTPFTSQAGATLARAREVALLRTSNEQSAIENEWLWWMVDSVSDPIVVTDEQNDIIRQNRPAELIFRDAPEDSEGKRNAIRMNNFLFTAALSSARLAPDGAGTSRELTLVDPIEGADLVFEMISRPAHHFRLNTTGVVSVLKNISDLRHAAEELTENVQRLQSADVRSRLERDRLDLVLRNVPNPIIVLDSDDQIIEMNQEAERLFAPPRAAAKARIAASNNAKFASFVSQLRLDWAAARSGELTLIDPDSDEPMAMAAASTKLYDDHGVFVGNVTVMQDLTRLRELERRRVEQQLFESEKLAATGRLAASIAHEINNPLEAIKNSLYLLVRRVDAEDPNRRFLEIAVKETERVSRILRQMLGFYRSAVSTGPTDVNLLLLDAQALIEKDLRQKGVRLHDELSPDLPLINASADQLKQVVLNLLLNACDAMPGGGEIFLSTRLANDADPEFLLSHAVVIQVRDTGKGIPEEQMGAIFEPFFSTKHDQRGTGLGLWVSQGIVQRHGGTLKVRSRLGQGATFTIALPIEGPAKDG